jgi:hypothetical protein
MTSGHDICAVEIAVTFSINLKFKPSVTCWVVTFCHLRYSTASNELCDNICSSSFGSSSSSRLSRTGGGRRNDAEANNARLARMLWNLINKLTRRVLNNNHYTSLLGESVGLSPGGCCSCCCCLDLCSVELSSQPSRKRHITSTACLNLSTCRSVSRSI